MTMRGVIGQWCFQDVVAMRHEPTRPRQRVTDVMVLSQIALWSSNICEVREVNSSEARIPNALDTTPMKSPQTATRHAPPPISEEYGGSEAYMSISVKWGDAPRTSDGTYPARTHATSTP
jgi:hypothetical protein